MNMEEKVFEYLDDLKEYNGPDTTMKPLTPFVVKKIQYFSRKGRGICNSLAFKGLKLVIRSNNQI